VENITHLNVLCLIYISIVMDSVVSMLVSLKMQNNIMGEKHMGYVLIFYMLFHSFFFSLNNFHEPILQIVIFSLFWF
jgi:hypothetical protein